MKLLYESKRSYRFAFHTESGFSPHLHNAVEVTYLTEGRVLITHGNEKTWLYAGDVFISFPDQIHGYENCENARGYILILPTKLCLNPYYKTLTEKVPVQPFLRKGTWEHTGLPALVEMAYRDKNRVSEEVMLGYFQVLIGKMLMLLTLRDARVGSDDALRTILLYINEHYTQPLSRKLIAKAAGYDESYVSHLFSKTLKTTIPQYINSLRMNDAARMLTQTDLTITQIASELGFGSIRNFNRVFLEHMGMSPKEYRKGTGSEP